MAYKTVLVQYLAPMFQERVELASVGRRLVGARLTVSKSNATPLQLCPFLLEVWESQRRQVASVTAKVWQLALQGERQEWWGC